MLRLSGFCKSKEFWSVGYDYMVCDDNNEWFFGVPGNEWSVWVPGDEWYIWFTDVYWRILYSTLDSP